WMFTSCTPVIAADARTAPATVFGMSWNLRSRKMPEPSAAISLTAAGPAEVKSWLPILNMPTRSETWLANLTAEERESKSSATIRLLRGWASNVTGLTGSSSPRPRPDSGSALCRQLHQFQPDLIDARVNQAELTGDAIGYINFASFLVGSAVVDAH